MRQPVIAQLMPDILQYWAAVDGIKKEKGSHPQWAFDFISVHSKPTGGFGLVSPMCIIEKTKGIRPGFEKESFAKKTEAVAAARQLARQHSKEVGRKIFVVDCK